MTCEECRDRLPLIILDEIDPETRAEIDAHLNDCPGCRAELENLGKTSRLLTNDPADDLTRIERLELENAVFRRLADKSIQASPSRPLALTYILRIAAAVALVVIGYGARVLVAEPPEAAGPVEIRCSEIDEAIGSGMRFSAAGLKVIARGRQALAAETGRALERP